MTWNAVAEEAVAVIPEGEYPAELIDVRDMDGPRGRIVRMDFMLSTDDEHDGRQISGIANKKLSENTKLGRWVAALISRMPNVGEEVTMRDLLNKKCRVVIGHKTNDDGQMFANVVKVLPVTIPDIQ